MIKKLWLMSLLGVANVIGFGSTIPNLVSSNHTELVLLAPIVAGLILTGDYYAIKTLLKKEEEKEND